MTRRGFAWQGGVSGHFVQRETLAQVNATIERFLAIAAPPAPAGETR